jgi:signal transduction histidine kinase
MDKAIQESNKNLEKSVNKRTRQLLESNKRLKNEIETRQLIERQLRVAKINAEIANQAKSSFVANMSHEFRTPLNHIIGFTDLVLDKDVGDLNETQEEYLSDVKKSGMHLLSLINDILDISKVEAGKLEYRPSKIKTRELLENSVTMVKEKAFKHKIKLKMNFDKAPDSITADKRGLKQVMYNLLSNAVKFTPDSGTISIIAKGLDSDGKLNQHIMDAHDRHLMVSITDTGIGIKTEHLSKVFYPFEQIQNALKRNYPGTGLGLSLSKKLIEMHDGKIWAESQGEGQGSTFHFIIPGSKKM